MVDDFNGFVYIVGEMNRKLALLESLSESEYDIVDDIIDKDLPKLVGLWELKNGTNDSG